MISLCMLGGKYIGSVIKGPIETFLTFIYLKGPAHNLNITLAHPSSGATLDVKLQKQTALLIQ